MSGLPGRAPRWDPDDRGVGIADARAHLDLLDALRRVADEDGWVAEDLRWAGPADADRRAVRSAAFDLIGAIAEGATVVHEERRADRATVLAVVTGSLHGETGFASHGHTLRLRLGSDA